MDKGMILRNTQPPYDRVEVISDQGNGYLLVHQNGRVSSVLACLYEPLTDKRRRVNYGDRMRPATSERRSRSWRQAVEQ
jgi:hypothetical protein